MPWPQMIRMETDCKWKKKSGRRIGALVLKFPLTVSEKNFHFISSSLSSETFLSKEMQS